MPHKRNPILSERLCGMARLLRGYASVGFENNALWQERDISHSSAERVVLPDATILAYYMLRTTGRILRGLQVYKDRMLENLDLGGGVVYSGRVLLDLVEAGMTRDDAYRLVQESAQRAWDSGTPFRELLAERIRDPDIPGRETEEVAAIDWDAVFDYDAYLKHVPEVMERLEALGS